MCPHEHLKRVKKNNGISPTHDPDIKMIFGDCDGCGSTDVMAFIYKGWEIPRESVWFCLIQQMLRA